MKIDAWRKEKGFSYEGLARALDMTTSKVYRICKEKDNCIRLADAHRIVRLTKAEVNFADLLVGDC